MDLLTLTTGTGAEGQQAHPLPCTKLQAKPAGCRQGASAYLWVKHALADLSLQQKTVE